MKKIVFVLFVIIALIIFFNLRKPEKTESVSGKENAAIDYTNPVNGDWLVRHLPAEPSTLNPILVTDVYGSQIDGELFDSLIRRDPKTLEFIPQLASSWEISPDHLVYTFHLRKDACWHDGKPFTANDVKFSYDKIMDPKVDAAPLRNYYRDIKKVEVLDPYTVRFTYSQPYFRALEFCGGLPIVPAHIFGNEDFNQHPFGRDPIGTGPYKFVKWDTGKEIVLERNEKYWGKKPHIDKIVYKIITDNTVAFQVLKQGGLDLMSLRPIQWVKQTRSKRFKKHFRKLKYFLPSYNYIGWNMRRVYFKDKRVRRALTMLVDRQGILKDILYNLGVVVTGPFYINSPAYDKSIKPYPYDPQRAEKLLAEAGWIDHDGDGIRDKDGTKFSFEFLISAGSKFAEQLSTILKESLKRHGIHMTIRRLEWAVFIQQIDDRQFDACTLGWSMGWESDPYQIWHSSQAKKGSNFVGFVNKEADEIIEKARREFDSKKRNEMYHRFHRIIHEEQPYTFLFTMNALVAVDKRFQNVNVYPMGLEPREWWVPVALQRYK
ncbi:MAG TPA: peptide-binding protein [Deltaproteobacteria bacterium]|nr:peptide-binding protein [Deltaproteobacteria bacterium]